MAGDTNSNIFINIDTSQAMAQLRALEKELTALNRALIVGTKTAAQAQSKYAQSLIHNVNATGQWTASTTRMKTATEQFATALDRSKLSLKEYFRYGMASTKTFGRFFGSEFDTVGKLVEKRVKTLQQQYVQLGRDAQGAMNALKFTPKALNYRDVTTQLMMAVQRQQIFNKLLDDGATKLLNFGKNTQWAGRQLMVGFTIPLMLFGSQAIRTFKEIETQVIRFKKVYGDIFTDQGATDQALKNIQKLANEYTKYGLKVSETIKMAADAAAAGFSGKGLQDLVEQTNKLAVLGGVTQEKALETTIALRNAFKIDEKQLSGTIDFLNAVENQTVVALDDLTEAIPRVAPVVQQLGGDVKDLSFFMAAMQEGGISAAQGANALKSGLASLINPSKKAAASAAELGINLKGIVEENQGNLRNIVMAFAKSLQPLTDLQRTRIIEQIFGKYQFARISALLNNITKEGSQAARVLQLANASAEELAILTQREMKIQADSPMNRLAGAVEKFKAAIAPIGKLFAEVLTPVIEYLGKLAERFNKLPDGVKKAIAIILGVVGGIGPVFLMTFGLVANAFANSLKGVNLLRKGYQQLAYGSSDAALKTQYLTNEELENISITNSLYSKHEQLSAAYRLEQQALASLIATYTQANTAMGGFAARNPGMFTPGKGMPPKRFADGTTSVPGPRGAGDVVPSMLSPGEAVIPAKQSEKYSGFISQIIQDKVPGFITGRFPLFGNAANVATQSIRGIKPGQIPAAQQRFLGMSEEEQNALIASRMGKTIGKPLISQIPGLTFEEASGGRIKVMAGDSFFYIKKESLPKLQNAMKEHQEYMVSIGKGDKTLSEIIKQIKRPGSGKKPRPAFQGSSITPSQLYSRLPKWSKARVRTQGIEVANKRYDLLMKSRNPHLLKLKNYLDTEEKEYLRKVLPPDVFDTLNFDAKRLAPSHIREVGKDRSGSWTPDKIARDWDWFNKALIGTKMGNVSGGHPLNSKQAQEIIQNLLAKRQYKKSIGQDLSARQQGLLAALQYRISRKPSFYDEFTVVDNAMMKRMPKPMQLADGIVSVPGPKGAGDIQPAMLSPGEAVIPAKQSEKYMPLIRSIVADKVPGFAGSNLDDPWDTPSTTPKSRSDILADRMTGKLIDATTKPGIIGRIARGATAAIDRAANSGPTPLTSREKAAAARAVPMPAFSHLEQSLDKNTKAVQGGTDATEGSTKNAKESAREQRRYQRTTGIPGYLRGFGNVPINDPQTGAKLTTAQRYNYRQHEQMMRGQRLMGPSMAASMAGSMAMMYGASKPDSIIGQNMNLIMGFTMLAGLLPLLNSPMKMMIAGVIGLVALYKLQSAQIKQAIKDGQTQGKAMMMTTDNLESLGKITGQVSITQEEEMKRRSRTTEITPVSMDFGKNLITNEDYGKQLKATFDKTVEELGAGAAVESLSNQLSTAVSQGVLTGTQAESIAVAITRDLKDARLEMAVRGRLIQLIGPRGENVLQDPLKVQLDIIASGQKIQQAAFQNLQNVIGKERSGLTGVGGKEAKQMAIGAIPAAGAGLYGIGAANVALGAEAGGVLSKIALGARALGMASKGAAVVPVGGWVAATLGTIIFGGIELGIRKFQQGQEKKAIGKAAGIFQAVSSENLKASQQALDAFNVEINIAIKNLEVKKKAAKTAKERADIEQRILNLEEQRSSGAVKIREEQSNILKTLADQYGQIGKETFFENILPGGPGRGALRQKFMESFDVGLQEKFKNNAVARAELTGTTSLLEQKYGTKGDEISLQIKTLISSDVLTPREAGLVVANLSDDTKIAKKELEAMVNVLGTEGLQRLGTIMTFLPKEKNRKALQLYVQTAGKQGADEIMSSLEEIIKFPSYLGININLETQQDDIKDLARIGKEISDIKEKFPEGKVTKELLVKMQEEAGGKGKNLTLDTALAQWDAISKLPKELQFQAIISIGSISQSDSFDKILDRELEAAFLKANPQYAGGGPNKDQFAFNTKESKERFMTQRKIAMEEYKKDADNIAKATAEYWKKTAPEIWGNTVGDNSIIPPATPTGTTEGGAKGSWLQDIGQRLKLVKESSFDALNTLKELRKFYGEGQGKTVNPMLADQKGALDAIRKAAKDAGIVLSEDFMGIIEGFSADEFKNFAKDFLTLTSKGRVKGLKDDFLTVNAGLRSLAAGNITENIDRENQKIKDQIDAYNILKKEGYNRLEIERILQDETMTAMIKEQGFLSLSISEREDLNNSIRQTISLRTQEQLIETGKQIDDIERQVVAYDKLAQRGLKQEAILEILKNSNYVWSVVTGDNIDEIIAKTELLIKWTNILAEKQKTAAEKIQEAMDRAMNALTLEENLLQTAFDKDTFDLNVKIRLAQDAVEDINRDIQAKQDQIEAIRLDVKYKFDIPIEDLQEQISDLQRKVEEQFNRPIESLQRQSNLYSRDLELMDRQAEKINEKYDAQEQALSKISEINQDIINQQKGQISLAEALSSGDIAAAAQAAQDMRATAAEAASRNNGDILKQAREAELANLRSASGLTRAQIEQAQLDIQDRIYAIEQDRLALQDEIRIKEDALYKLQEDREDKLLSIRNLEIDIDNITKNRLKPAQQALDDLQRELDLKQRDFDLKLDKINKEKLKWEDVKNAFDLYTKAVDEANKGPIKTQADILKSIADAYTQLQTEIKGSSLTATELDALKAKAATRQEEIAQYDKDLAALKKILALPLPPDEKAAEQAAFNAKYPQGRPTAITVPSESSKITPEQAQKIADIEKIKKDVLAETKKIEEGIVEVKGQQDLKNKEIIVSSKDINTELKYMTTEIGSHKAMIESLLDPKNPSGMFGLQAAWTTVKDLIDGAKNKISEYIASLGTAISTASQLVSEIMKLNTTVTTTHIINTINYVTTVTNDTTKKAFGGKIKGYMNGGKINPLYRSYGGSTMYMNDGGFKAVGSDTVPAMLTPGEFVVNRAATQQFLPLLESINGTKYPSMLGGNLSSPLYNVSSPSSISVASSNTSSSSINNNSSSVYNYNVEISVGGTNATPDSIARAVMNEIKYIDSQRIQGQKVS